MPPGVVQVCKFAIFQKLPQGLMSTLHSIAMITLRCPDPVASAAAYCRCLHYRRAGVGRVPAQLAQLWGQAELAGMEYILLAPAGDDRHFIRLLRCASDVEYRAFSAAGWNAAEILVNNVDTLAEELAGSPFAVVGPPADLSFTDKIRACQVIGPAGEALYLTQIKGEIPGFSLTPTEQTVAWCFVVILAGASLPASMAFYRTRFAIAEAPVMDARVTLMSAAFELPRAQLHRISALTLGDPGYLLELDELPSSAASQPAAQGLSRPGIAIVSFNCGATPPEDATATGLVPDEPPYNGRRVSVCTGAAGELLELIHE